MTNREKYAEQILDVVCAGEGLAFDKRANRPVACSEIDCDDCLFNSSDIDEACSYLTKKWCKEEYVGPPVDWSKIAVDTPILVKDGIGGWLRRHFAKYENNKIFAWADGRTSWTCGNSEMHIWERAKLSEETVEQ